MLVANKRFSNNYQLYASFTWSRAWWVPKGFRDKNELINGEGVFRIERARSRDWMFKLGGAWAAPYGITVGTNFIYQQGASWERTVFVSGLNQGGKFVKAEQRGKRRMPNELYFDFKIDKRFNIKRRYAVEVSLDIINVPNKDTPLSYVSYTAESPSWMVPTSIIMPRRAMLGLKFVF